MRGTGNMNTKNKKENGKEKDLFNTLADSVGCDYVSDLRYEPFNSSAKHLIARDFTFENYRLDELNDLFEYLYDKKAEFSTVREAKAAFCAGSL